MIARAPGRADASGRGPRASTFATSLAIHVLLIAVFPLLLTAFRSAAPPKEKTTDIVFYRRPAPRPEPPRPPVAPKPRPIPVEAPPIVARVEPQRPAPAPPRPAPPVEAPLQVARREPPAATPAPMRKPDPPRPVVRAAGFEEAGAATAAARAPAREIRTAGFGAKNASTAAPVVTGLRGSTRIGGFEVASEGPRGEVAARPRQASGSAQGAGFDAPAGAPSAKQPSSASGTVNTGGFGDPVAPAAPPQRRERPSADPDTPVEIRSKPKPAYTAEARENKVEGEVVLEVVFGAAGELRVLRVVEGLGFGLDQSAVDAARQIEFRPARRSGESVDHTAMLRIVFQLA